MNDDRQGAATAAGRPAPRHPGNVMEELKFNCPAYVAQRFWLLCVERDSTPGAVLRDFMLHEIAKTDAAFEFELRAATGKDLWTVSRG